MLRMTIKINLEFRENVGWASTCNSVGQTAGFFLGNAVFLALESTDFANRFVRKPLNLELQSTGLITLPSKMLNSPKKKIFFLRRFSSILGNNVCYINNISCFN